MLGYSVKSKTMDSYPVVRRWRGNHATISVHEPTCPSVKPMEVIYYERAESVVLAESQAFKELRAEMYVGTSKWGKICRECDAIAPPVYVYPIHRKPKVAAS